MVIHCVAFVGKHNDPLFVHIDSFSSDRTNLNTTNFENMSVYLESIIFSSLDVVEERRCRKIGSATAAQSSQEMFLGQLLVIEDYRVFAWCSNTYVKTIIVCDISATETLVKDVLKRLYHLYVEAVQNPFQSAGKPIQQAENSDDRVSLPKSQGFVVSKTFASKIRETLSVFNGPVPLASKLE